MKYTVYCNSKSSHIRRSSLSVDSNEKLREQSRAENQSSGKRPRKEHKYMSSAEIAICNHFNTTNSFRNIGYYDVALVNLSTQTSKGVFIETPPLPVHLVKVFSVLGPRGLPQTFDVWDEMENEMLFNKQPAMSECLPNKKGQTLMEKQLQEKVRGCRPNAQI